MREMLALELLVDWNSVIKYYRMITGLERDVVAKERDVVAKNTQIEELITQSEIKEARIADLINSHREAQARSEREFNATSEMLNRNINETREVINSLQNALDATIAERDDMASFVSQYEKQLELQTNQVDILVEKLAKAEQRNTALLKGETKLIEEKNQVIAQLKIRLEQSVDKFKRHEKLEKEDRDKLYQLLNERAGETTRIRAERDIALEGLRRREHARHGSIEVDRLQQYVGELTDEKYRLDHALRIAGENYTKAEEIMLKLQYENEQLRQTETLSEADQELVDFRLKHTERIHEAEVIGLRSLLDENKHLREENGLLRVRCQYQLEAEVAKYKKLYEEAFAKQNN